MARKPKVWFDLEYLDSLGDGPGELFYLTEPAQQVLSQLAEMLLWPTRWYADIIAPYGTDVPPLARELYEELKVPLHVDDLVKAIYDTACCQASSIKDFSTGNSYSVPYGENSGTVAAVGDAAIVPDATEYTAPVGATTSNGSIDGDSSGTISQAEWDTYLCGMAHWYFDTAIELMNLYRTFNLVGGWGQQAIYWFLERLLRKLVVNPAQDWALATWQELTSLINAASNSDLLDQIDAEIAALETARDDTICCMVQATNAKAFADCLIAALNATLSTSAAALFVLFPWYSLSVFVWKALLPSEDRTCDCEPSPLWSEYTNFGSDFDGMGLWSGNTVVRTDHVEAHDDVPDGNNLYRTINAVDIPATATHFRATINWHGSQDGAHLVWQVANVSTVQYTVQYVSTYTEEQQVWIVNDVNNQLQLRIGTSSINYHVKVADALIEFFDTDPS